MAWVRSEYAGALAVLCTWAVALLPWSVTWLSVGGITQIVVRFHWAALRFQYGAPELDLEHLTVLGAVRGTSGGIRHASLVWLGAAAVVTALILFSVAYYLREERVEEFPGDPVRLTGGVLLVVGIAHVAAVWLFHEHRPGTTIPLGVLFELVFAGLLLTVERAG